MRDAEGPGSIGGSISLALHEIWAGCGMEEEVVSPPKKRRRGRPAKGQPTIKWTEFCVSLVQDGVRSIGPWVCTTCSKGWDVAFIVWRRKGWVCTREKDEAAAVAATISLAVPGLQRTTRQAAAAAAVPDETPSGNGLASQPAAAKRETVVPDMFGPPDTEFRCLITGSRNASRDGDLHPATARRQLAGHACASATCSSSNCVPQFIMNGQGGYTGRAHDLRPGAKRAATASASSVLSGAAALVLPDDPDGALLLAFCAQQHKMAKELTVAAAAVKRADPMDTGPAYDHAVARLESGMAQQAELAKALAVVQTAVSKRHGTGASRKRTRSDTAADADAERASKIATTLISARGGEEILGQLRGLKPLARRPALAYFVLNCTRDEVSTALNERGVDGKVKEINKTEWSGARNHACWPGVGQPVPKYEYTAMRCKVKTLEKFLSVLERGDMLQGYAYGEKIMELTTGLSVALDAVNRMISVQQITAQYLEHVDAEMDLAASNYVEPVCRCASQHTSTRRRCMKAQGHMGSHKFTPKGSMSAELISNLVRSMTMGDVVSLSGLDDIATVCGYENFRRLKVIIRELGSIAMVSGEEIAAAEAERVQTELFHKVHFRRHLARTGTTQCSCLSCGFHSDTAGEEVPCPQRGQHSACCQECVRGFDLISTLHSWAARAQQLSLGVHALDELHELQHELTECQANLVHYRSHLARKRAENDYKADRRLHLPEDVVLITADWKKKILEARFRENMKAWYSKTGRSMLGFMAIAKNGTDAYKCMFYMLFTDDPKQDAPSVLAAKTLVLNELIPKDFPNARKFYSDYDGAGCFAGNVMHAAQPEWGRWTSQIANGPQIEEQVDDDDPPPKVAMLEEEELHVDVSGDGKSALDGEFGHVGPTMQTSLNSGMSYSTAETMLAAATARGGHRATVFGVYATVEPDTPLAVKDTVDLTQYRLVRLERGADGKVTGLRGWKQSGYGAGTLAADLTGDGLWNGTQEPDVPEYTHKLQVLSDWNESKPTVGAMDQSEVIKAAKGRTRASNKEARVQDLWAEEIAAIKKARLFPCEVKDPETGAPCRRRFGTKFGLRNHLTRVEQVKEDGTPKDTHRSGMGHSARDVFLRMAASNGHLKAGTLPNRSTASEAPVFSSAAELGVGATESETERRALACAVGGYRKPPRKESVDKTPAQAAWLDGMWAEGDGGKVWKPDELRTEMRKKKDADTGLLYFSHAPGNRNGGVLTEEQIKDWIKTRTTAAKKHGRGRVRDKIDFMKKAELVEELKSALGTDQAMWAAVNVTGKTKFGKVSAGDLRDAVRVATNTPAPGQCPVRACDANDGDGDDGWGGDMAPGARGNTVGGAQAVGDVQPPAVAGAGPSSAL